MTEYILDNSSFDKPFQQVAFIQNSQMQKKMSLPGKDDNYILRAKFWLMAFGDKPVKSIKAEHVEKILSKYAAGEVEGYGPAKLYPNEIKMQNLTPENYR